MRASDADRERLLEELNRHAAEGRLRHDELEQRVAAALEARTVEALADLRADLPALGKPQSDDLGEHLRVFAAVQLLLVAIWALTGADYFWPVWPFVGWGAALLLHAACDRGPARSRPRAIRPY